MRRNSGIIGPRQTISTDAAVGMFDLFDNYNEEINGKWPIVKKVISISNSNFFLSWLRVDISVIT